MSKRFLLPIIISIIILSFLLRIYDLGGESLWSDEGMSVYISKMSILEIIGKTNIDPNPPLYYIFMHFWIEIFGNSEFSIRFPSVIFGILSVYMIYKLGELIFNNKIGLLSSFILSISLYHIRYSQEARPYSLLILLVLLSNYYFIKILESKERGHIIGYIIFSIMMIYTHVFGLFYLLFQNVYYLIRRQIHIKLWIIIQGIILPFFILWLYLLLDNIERLIDEIDSDYIMSGINDLPTFDSVRATFIKFVSNEQILYIFIIVVIIGLIIDNIGDYRKYIEDNKRDIEDNKKDIDKYIFMVLWLFLPFVISIIISYTIGSIYHNRYFIASFPALILLFSKGMFNFRKISIVLLILSIIIILQIPLIKEYYQDIQKDQWRETAEYIKNVKDSKDGKDTILLFPDFTKTVFGYYYKNYSVYSGINNYSDIKLWNNSTKIWIIYSHMGYQERKEELVLIKDELSRTYVKKETIKFIGIKLDEYTKIIVS